MSIVFCRFSKINPAPRPGSPAAAREIPPGFSAPAVPGQGLKKNRSGDILSHIDEFRASPGGGPAARPQAQDEIGDHTDEQTTACKPDLGIRQQNALQNRGQ